MTLLPFFEWCESTALGATIRESVWLFPVIEAVHLVALVLIGGAILVGDLRLLRVMFVSQPAAQVVRDTQPWLIGALLVLVGTGVPLFLSEATKCYYSGAFRVKIITLALVTLFAFTIRRTAVYSGKADATPNVGMTLGAISISLWFVVAVAGRWIGFSG